jgi:hypothetical protein
VKGGRLIIKCDYPGDAALEHELDEALERHGYERLAAGYNPVQAARDIIYEQRRSGDPAPDTPDSS